MPDGYQELTQPWEWRADNGLLLRGRRAGGDAPAVHFLSGAGFCGGVYAPFLRRFLPKHGLFVHDIEGTGESDAPAHFSGVEAVLRRVHAVMQAQGLAGKPLIGMGHSFGAALTLRLAADHPGLFERIVLLDPIVFPTREWLALRLLSAFGRHPFAMAARRRRNAWPSRDAAIEHLRGRGIYKGWSEESLASFVDYATKDQGGQRVLRCPRELESEIYDRPVYPWRAFPKVQCPIHFLRGESSYDFFPAAEAKAARANPRVQVERIRGAHCFMLEDPALAHAAVERFLA